jgi:hypothetical protein
VTPKTNMSTKENKSNEEDGDFEEREGSFDFTPPADILQKAACSLEAEFDEIKLEAGQGQTVKEEPEETPDVKVKVEIEAVKKDGVATIPAKKVQQFPFNHPISGEFHFSGESVHVHIDLRYDSKLVKSGHSKRTRVQTHINEYMKGLFAGGASTFLYDNRRYCLLVKADGKTSYEQWIVPSTFDPSQLVRPYKHQLIVTTADFERLRGRFGEVRAHFPTMIDMESRHPNAKEVGVANDVSNTNALMFVWVNSGSKMTYFIYLFNCLEFNTI